MCTHQENGICIIFACILLYAFLSDISPEFVVLELCHRVVPPFWSCMRVGWITLCCKMRLPTFSCVMMRFCLAVDPCRSCRPSLRGVVGLAVIFGEVSEV